MVTPETKKKVGEFLLYYGDFFAFWSTFDLIIEILIMRKLGIDEEQTCIVCAGLNFGSKIAILTSLLSRHADCEPQVAMIKKAQTLAARNGFAHGFFLLNRQTAEFQLIRREVKDRYTATSKKYDHEKMRKHTNDFTAHVTELMKSFSVSEDDIEGYIKHIEAYALAQASQDKSRPAPRASSKKATKK